MGHKPKKLKGGEGRFRKTTKRGRKRALQKDGKGGREGRAGERFKYKIPEE